MIRNMKSLLTCTDGSTYAKSTYQYSAWAAKKLQLDILLVHTLDPELERINNPEYSGNLVMNASKELLEEIIEQESTKAKIEREKGKLILKDGLEFLTAEGLSNVKTEQRHGTLIETIIDLQNESDLIFMGKRGEHFEPGIKNLGQNLEESIRNSKKPVFVASREFRPIEKFLFCYDDSPTSNKALEFLVSNDLLKGIAAHILYVGKENSGTKEKVDSAKRLLEGTGSDVTAEVISGSPEEVVVETASKTNADLLVMGSYGHSRIHDFLFGSTTSALVKAVELPVMLFH